MAAPTIFKGFSAQGAALYDLEHAGKKWINYNVRDYFSGTTVLDADATFYSFKNSHFLTPGLTYQPGKLWLTPQVLTERQAISSLALEHNSYDRMLTVTLPKGTEIVTPRPVWSLFGRSGGGIETRVNAPVPPSWYSIGPSPK